MKQDKYVARLITECNFRLTIFFFFFPFFFFLKPGRLVFDFWTLLVTLLQADDLEVKDVVASISGKLCSSGMGESVATQRSVADCT